MKSIKIAADLLNNDGVIILPTDTIYGFSCHPDSVLAVEKIRELKQRDNKPFLLLDNNFERIKTYFSQTAKLQNFLNQLIKFEIWPDHLTLIAEKNSACDFPFLKGYSTIGVRFCTYPIVAEICNIIKGAITSTSINISGQKELTELSEIRQMWQTKVDLIVPAINYCKSSGNSSVILSFSCKTGKVDLLRSGSKEIMNKLNDLTTEIGL